MWERLAERLSNWDRSIGWAWKVTAALARVTKIHTLGEMARGKSDKDVIEEKASSEGFYVKRDSGTIVDKKREASKEKASLTNRTGTSSCQTKGEHRPREKIGNLLLAG